jgi:hypothetical protein
MKKLGKITINPEKVIKNDELVNLKGGYGEGPVSIYCYDASFNYLGCISTNYCHGSAHQKNMCNNEYSGTEYTHCMEDGGNCSG